MTDDNDSTGTVWVVHDFADDGVVSVHATPESADYMLRGRKDGWYVRPAQRCARPRIAIAEHGRWP